MAAQVHHAIGVTNSSGNGKIGRIPATWSTKSTCPPSCPFLKIPEGKKGEGCYWFSGYRTRAIGNRLAADPARGFDKDQFIGWILTLPVGQLWRDRVGGDQLPDLGLDPTGETIDAEQLRQVTRANKRRKARGFGFTHYDVIDNLHNRAEIQKAANDWFTLNASANNIRHALQIRKAAPLLSIAVTVPSDYKIKDQTIDGLRLILCPNHWNKKITCQQCQLCAIPRRDYAIALPAHGTGKTAANLIASAA
jgi:hypothetical protein